MVKKILSLILLFLSLFSFGQTVVNPVITGDVASKVISEIGKPVFRKNTGQYNPDILYRLTSGQTSIAFYKNKVQFGLRKQGKQKMKSKTEMGSVAFCIWEMSFENMSPEIAIAASEKFPTRFNQFRAGSDVSVDLEDYGKLTYKNVYKNIDLVFYLSKDEKLKYDFIVRPGGDYSQIKLKYDGLKKLKTDSKGNLTLITPWGNKIKEGKPVSWQITPNGKVPVDINYSVQQETLTYKTNSSLDPNSTLVIDPMMLDWSTYFYGKLIGNSNWGFTYLLDMDIDKDNYVYACGMTTEAYPTKVNTYDTVMGSSFNYEGFVAKMSLNADSLLLFTYIGGSTWEYILSITVNAQKQPVISGFTYSNDYPITSNAYDKSGGTGSGYRGFITKFSTDFKTLVYSTYFGKSNSWATVIQSMQLTANGDVIFTGNTNAQDFPVTAGCMQNTYGGGANDAFLTRLSADGSKLIYSTYFGGTGDDRAADLSVNATEDVYLVGSTANSNFPLTIGAQGPFKYTNSDAGDGFVARIQKDGKKLLWSKMMGGNDIDAFEGLFVNSNDELYIGGYSKSSNFYTSANALQPSNAGGYDHIVVKMNKGGTNVFYSTYLGGSLDDVFYPGYYWWNSNIRICANVKDEAIIGGATKSTNYPVTKDALQPKNKAMGNSWACNLAITKLSYDGSEILYGTYFGGSYYEYPTVLKVKKISCMSSILYGGITLSNDYPTTKGVFHEKGKTGSSWYYQGFMSRFRDTLYTEPIGFKDNFIECDLVYEILDAKNLGAEYLWSTGAKTQYVIAKDTGTYWVRATYGCDTVRDTIRLKLEYAPHLNLTPDTILCNKTGFILDAENDTIPRKYLWNTNDTVQKITAKTPGLYYVTVTTPNCGFVTDSSYLRFLKKPDIANIKDSIFCDKINWPLKTDSLGPGTKYYWSTNDSGLTTTVSKVGNYFLKVNNYCGSDSVNFKTSLLYKPIVKLPKDTIICNSFILKYKAGRKNNDETYNWFDPVNKISYGIDDSVAINAPGYLGISIKNKCGEVSDSLKIDQRISPKINIGKDSVYCDKISKSIKIGLAGNFESYLWSTANPTNSQLITQPGTYWARIKNLCGEIYDTITFTQKNSLKIDIGRDSLFCNTVSKSLDITQPDPNAVYKWHDGSGNKTYTSSKPEKVWASITNFCGTVSDTAVYTIINSPTVSLGKDYIFCDYVKPVSFTVGKAGNNETYLWSDSKTTTTNEFSTTGKHWVELKNKCGIAADTMEISTVISPTVEIGPDTALCGMFFLPLDAGNPGLAYYWEPTGEKTQSIIANKQVIYKVTVTDANGCFGKDFMQVKDDCKSKWYVPTSFSPNGDFINDEFAPVLINCDYYSLKIYDRWGEKLFETNNPFTKWNGSYKGQIVQDGSYIYTINFQSSEDKKWYNINGGLLLLR